MTIQADSRAVFAAVKTAHPELVLAVVSGSQTANGINVMSPSQESALASFGNEDGLKTFRVQVDASEMTEPAQNADITVGGAAASVKNTKKDPFGAFLIIEGHYQRPVVIDPTRE